MSRRTNLTARCSMALLCATPLFVSAACSDDAKRGHPDDAGAVDAAPDAPICTAPTTTTGCAALNPTEVLAFVYCRAATPGPYLPSGHYPDRPDPGRWETPCSKNAAETHDRAIAWASNPIHSTGDSFDILSDSTSTYFFESVIRFNNATVNGDPQDVRYRNTRCDYFDGNVLKGAPFQSATPLVILASYLWYTESATTSGSHVLAGLTSTTPTEHRVSLCHTQMTYGDWGLCDQIKVVQTDYSLESSTGKLTVGQPQSALSLEGECH